MASCNRVALCLLAHSKLAAFFFPNLTTTGFLIMRMSSHTEVEILAFVNYSFQSVILFLFSGFLAIFCNS